MAWGSVDSQFGTALLWHAKLKNVSPRLQLLENKPQRVLSSLDSLKVCYYNSQVATPFALHLVSFVYKDLKVNRANFLLMTLL